MLRLLCLICAIILVPVSSITESFQLQQPQRIFAQSRFGVWGKLRGGSLLVSSSGQESVYVFKQEKSEFIYLQTITTPNLTGLHQPIVMQGNDVLISVLNEVEPQVFYYNRIANFTLEFIEAIAPEEEAPGFGAPIFISGDTLAIGAAGNPAASFLGKIFIYKKIENRWSLQAVITEPPESVACDLFATEVSINSDASMVIVGAEGYRDGRGAVYVFKLRGQQWELLQEISPSELREGESFGYKIGFVNDATFLSCAPFRSEKPRLGACYVYTLRGNSWEFHSKIKSPDHSGPFGWQLDINQGQVLLNHCGDLSDPAGCNGVGYLYKFEERDTKFRLLQTFTKSKRVPTELFGGAPGTVDGNTVLIPATRAVIKCLPRVGVECVYLLSPDNEGDMNSTDLAVNNTINDTN